MPSSHSSSVVSMAISVGLNVGFDSTMFAIALVLAMIVMTDAAGVRLAASKQARLLNEIALSITTDGEVPREKLKELIGHTPVEVIAGALVGLCVAVLFS